MPGEPTSDEVYARIAPTYATRRTTDPQIAARIWAALGDARTILNVGAGTGSYEPTDRDVTAVEPSAAMREARPPGAAPCIEASADDLPFADGTFDAAMAVLSDHHWPDPVAGYRELARVARRVVVFQWDNHLGPHPFWLIRDYLPEFRALAAGKPSLQERAASIDATITPVPIPSDCADAFFPAFWGRPEAYLDPAVRASTSVWARLGPDVEARVTAQLARDLADGTWHRRNAALLTAPEADIGARLMVRSTA
ncbi:MAG: class I SAM-dependent methyltransferase [Solirubrobacteraceae bacterium]|nr:class I SAM-dependent methyltransferase [Patulibacter sp.]